MKVKLIKDEEGYSLFTKEEGSNNRKIIATTEGIYVKQKLSKQNCDEIFGVFDVDKLAMGYELYEKINFVGQTRAYIIGFNKAMELNKDKLFTLDDMKNAMDWMMTQYFEFNEQPTTGRRDEYLKSLQQPTEMDVEIEMKKVVDETKVIGAVKGVKGSGDKITTYKSIPKLDSNGCLILKREK